MTSVARPGGDRAGTGRAHLPAAQAPSHALAHGRAWSVDPDSDRRPAALGAPWGGSPWSTGLPWGPGGPASVQWRHCRAGASSAARRSTPDPSNRSSHTALRPRAGAPAPDTAGPLRHAWPVNGNVDHSLKACGWGGPALASGPASVRCRGEV